MALPLPSLNPPRAREAEGTEAAAGLARAARLTADQSQARAARLWAAANTAPMANSLLGVLALATAPRFCCPIERRCCPEVDRLRRSPRRPAESSEMPSEVKVRRQWHRLSRGS